MSVVPMVEDWQRWCRCVAGGALIPWLLTACGAEVASELRFGDSSSACSGSDCGPAATTASSSDSDDGEGSTGSAAEGSTGEGASPPPDGCPIDAECHFDADCIGGSCVDCSCVDIDGSSATDGGATDGDEATSGGVNTDAYGSCEAGCLANDTEVQLDLGCVCAPACGGFGEACPPDPSGIGQSFCAPVDDQLSGFACVLICEDMAGCPAGMTCNPTSQGFGVCVHP